MSKLLKHTRSKVGGNKKNPPISVFTSTDSDAMRKNQQLLEACYQYWDNLKSFRDERRRARNYRFGDQWSDKIYDPDSCKWMSEEQYLKLKGIVPLKQNIILPLVNNLMGQFRSSQNKPVVISRDREKAAEADIMSNAIQAVHSLNSTSELDASNMDEFAVSGVVCQRVDMRWIREKNRDDVWIENINPSMILFNTDIKDPRLADLKVIGVIHDIFIDDLLSRFAKSDSDAERLKQIFTPDHYAGGSFGTDTIDNVNFMCPTDANKCRVFEVWELLTERRVGVHDTLTGEYDIGKYNTKAFDAENAKRLATVRQSNANELARVQSLGLDESFANLVDEDDIALIEYKPRYEQFWYGRFLSSWGDVLWEGESPYAHEEHPFILKIYPLFDGIIKGFVSNLIDQQRYINRLTMMQDMIIKTSAKGVLLVPDDSIPANSSSQEMADEWSRADGVIVYKPNSKHNHVPKQISSNSTNIGLHELIAAQVSYSQEISGIHSAIRGVQAPSGTPASLYMQEAQNASLNNLDFVKRYYSFLEKRDNKVMKLVQQYYTQKRNITPVGRIADVGSLQYDPERIRNVEFDNQISYTQNTDVFRQLMNDQLVMLWQASAINIKQLLKHGAFPFADALLADIAQAEQSMEGQGQIQGLSAATVEQALSSANPEALEQLQHLSR